MELMRRFFRKPFAWAGTYSVVLAGFTAFVLLDTFVIPKAIPPIVEAAANPPTAATETTALSTTDTNTSIITTTSLASMSAAVTNALSTTITTAAAVPTTPATTPIITANSYKDSYISLVITQVRLRDTQVYIADIQISSLEYLKTAFANDTFGRNITQATSIIAAEHEAIFAVNGDFCGFRNSGYVIRDGVLYRNTVRSKSDDESLVIYDDGRFEIVHENSVSASTLLQQGALQVFSFGPSLLENGVIRVSPQTEVGQAAASNPRTALGMVSPLHYIFIVSDGRTGASSGLSLYELAAVFKDEGCQVAYNLDGGGSSTMWFNGKVINVPTDGRSMGERKISDIVYIGY
jgi:exopolysaccharide biosynthesis protein